MRRSLWCALTAATLIAPLPAIAAPQVSSPSGKAGIVLVDERRDLERSGSERPRCEDLARQEREVREQLEHERDRPDRERLEARLHEIERDRQICERH